MAQRVRWAARARREQSPNWRDRLSCRGWLVSGRYSVGIGALVVHLTACVSGEPGGGTAPREPGAYRVELVRVVAPAAGTPEEIIAPMDVAWGPDGTILVADLQPSQVKVLRRDGSLVRTIGGEGEGPGEFRSALIATNDSTLVVLDIVTGRLQSFAVADGVVKSHHVMTSLLPNPPLLDSLGRVIVASGSSAGAVFNRLTLASGVRDSVQLPDGGAARTPSEPWVLNVTRPDGRRITTRLPVPLQPRALALALRGGGFASGWTDEYRIHVWDDTLRERFVIGRAVTPVAVTAQRRRELIDNVIARSRMFGTDEILRPQLVPDRIPDIEPVIGAVHADDRGRFWVTRPSALGQGDSSLAIDLWSAEGVWLDSLSVDRELWPRAPNRPVFRGDEYVFLHNDADGRPVVVIAALSRTERT